MPMLVDTSVVDDGVIEIIRQHFLRQQLSLLRPQIVLQRLWLAATGADAGDEVKNNVKLLLIK